MSATDYVFNEEDAQRIADATRRAEELAYSQNANSVRGRQTANVLSGMRCTCAVDIPANSVVMIVSLSATVKGLYTVKKPDAANATEVVFVPKAITAGNTGKCFAPFDSDRQNMVTTNGVIGVGTVVGTVSGQWYLSTGQSGFKAQAGSGGLAYARPFRPFTEYDPIQTIQDNPWAVTNAPGLIDVTSDWYPLLDINGDAVTIEENSKIGDYTTAYFADANGEPNDHRLNWGWNADGPGGNTIDIPDRVVSTPIQWLSSGTLTKMRLRAIIKEDGSPNWTYIYFEYTDAAESAVLGRSLRICECIGLPAGMALGANFEFAVTDT